MMKKIIKKIWNWNVKFWKGVWHELKDWRLVVLFCIYGVILYTPSIIGYILHKPATIAFATAYIGFWLGPWTPATAICIVAALGTKKLLIKLKLFKGD